MMTSTCTPVLPGSGDLHPLGIHDVDITDGFWHRMQTTNRDAIVPHIAEWEERTGWLHNVDAVADGSIGGCRTGREFADSEVYKFLESLAWQIGDDDSSPLTELFDSIVARVAGAQCEDGYLNTCFGSPGQRPRYSDLEWGHELYCYGHLIQAGVARLRSGHHDALVDVALRAADHICRTFGPGGLERVCGHPEIEVALVELYRATGERRYLDQARLFLERRGHHTLADIEFGRRYFLDDTPIRRASVLRGHAVRALYLASGSIDAAAETGDSELLGIVEGQYRSALARRTYLTGGMGSHHQDEAFGDDFELPPDRAYCETCAGIGSVMVAWRLLLATGDISLADVIERTLYNVVAASPRLDGRAFFYTNPLHQRVRAEEVADDRPSPRAEAQLRAPWFEVSCCPTNVSRTLAQLGAYLATTSADGLQLLQYAAGRISTALPGGGRVTVRVDTHYPDDGRIAVTVEQAPAEPWQLTLGIPRWAGGATVTVGGQTRTAEAPAHVVSGLVAGGTVVLDLPMAPRFTFPDPRIDAVRGSVAVELGPLVLCAESVDLPGDLALDAVAVDAGAAPVAADDGAEVRAMRVPVDDLATSAYGPDRPSGGRGEPRVLRLVPYYRWANRGPSTMRVWLPTLP